MGRERKRGKREKENREKKIMRVKIGKRKFENGKEKEEESERA